MQILNIHAAKTQFSRLVNEVAAGEEIIIARAGKPIAKLVPLQSDPAPSARTLGILASRFTVPADFDKPLADEELAGFEGS